MSDIVRVKAWFVDTLGTERYLHSLIDDDNFNMLTGKFTLDSTIISYFNGLISDAKQEYSQVDGYDANIVLDFHIEKYRDITVERNDITPEEAQRIATMQSTHQSILEYTYQFTIAEQTQQRLSEICYTAFITITSTIIVMGATWGLNKAFNKFTSQYYLAKADSILSKPGVTASMEKSANYLTTAAAKMIAGAGRSASMNAFVVVKSIVEETLEEIYVDPVIEAYVTNAVADAGGSQVSQILWSGLAESGREQFLSSVTAFARVGAGTKTQLDIQLSSDLQSQLGVEQRLLLVQEQIQAQQDSQSKRKQAWEYIKEGLSPVLLSVGAISGGFTGSLASTIGTMSIIGGASAEGIDFMEDMFDMILKKKPSASQNSYLSDKITDSLQALVNIRNINQEVLGEAIEWAQLDEPQKQGQANYKYIASTFDVWSDMVRLRGGILGIKPVGIHLSPNDPDNEIGQHIVRPNIQDTYSTLELIEDLKNEVQLFSEELALLFPERVYRFKLTDLSEYWGYSSGYIAQMKYLYRKNPNNFQIDENKLSELEGIIKERLGEKALGCMLLFGRLKRSEISFWNFIEGLRLELGRISGEVSLTDDEASEIFGFLVDDLTQRITNPRKRNYNPNYKFSLKKLDRILSNVRVIFGDRAIKCRNLMESYKSLNPNLKEYSLQQHKVSRPHYFSKISAGQIIKAYLFGFMMADGYIESNGYSIGIELRKGDEKILIKFKETLGVEGDIKTRTIFRKYKGKVNKYVQSRLRFGCAPMWSDLTSLEYSSSKSSRKLVPNVIRSLVLEAKREAGSNWYDTIAGQTALAWLLGFYDGDGSYSFSGGDYGNIYSSSKIFLEDIKETFGFQHEVKEKEAPGDLVHVFDEELISKGYYYLGIDRLPVDLFFLMFNSYSDSLARKRPDRVSTSSNYLDLKY